MRPGQRQPNGLEIAIFERIAQDAPWLRGPFTALHVISREYTGVGGYTNFLCEVPEQTDDPFSLVSNLCCSSPVFLTALER